MKKYLLPEKANRYKANMHCHSTVSDGKLTPLQIKEAYRANGYSIVAYTDHDVLLGHTELRDDDFLPLHGYEMEFTETDDKPTSFKKTCHLCLVALEPDNLTQVCYHRTKYAIGNGGSYRDRIVFDEGEPDFEREHDPISLITPSKRRGMRAFSLPTITPAGRWKTTATTAGMKI